MSALRRTPPAQGFDDSDKFLLVVFANKAVKYAVAGRKSFIDHEAEEVKLCQEDTGYEFLVMPVRQAMAVEQLISTLNDAKAQLAKLQLAYGQTWDEADLEETARARVNATEALGAAAPLDPPTPAVRTAA